jgi:hypothetical protein
MPNKYKYIMLVIIKSIMRNPYKLMMTQANLIHS